MEYIYFVRKATIGLILSAVVCVSAKAASFDCAKATTKIENAICGSAKVSLLDERLNEIYSSVLLEHRDPDGVKTAQRTWIAQTRNTCPDDACLVQIYEQRIAALKASLPKEVRDAIADANVEAAADAQASMDAQEAELAASAVRERLATEEKVAAQAAADAQAKRIADQAVADEQAKKLTDEAAAKAAQEARQKFWMQIGIAGLTSVALVVAGWLWRRRQRGEHASRNRVLSSFDMEHKPTSSRISDAVKSSISRGIEAPSTLNLTEGESAQNAGGSANLPNWRDIGRGLINLAIIVVFTVYFGGKLLGLSGNEELNGSTKEVAVEERASGESTSHSDSDESGKMDPFAAAGKPDAETIGDFVARTLSTSEIHQVCILFSPAVTEMVAAYDDAEATSSIHNIRTQLMTRASDMPLVGRLYIGHLFNGFQANFPKMLPAYRKFGKVRFAELAFASCAQPAGS